MIKLYNYWMLGSTRQMLDPYMVATNAKGGFALGSKTKETPKI